MLSGNWADAQIAAPEARLTKAEQNVCQDLDRCTEILLAHDPDSFDYQVLAQDFQKLRGGLDRLLLFMGSDREKAVRRAQYILADASWQFSPDAQNEIARLWPRGDIKAHSQILVNIGTPLIRDRAIATLSHPKADIGAQSRQILRQMAMRPIGRDSSNGLTAAPLPPAVFQDLVQAGADNPTPEIITLIGTFANAQSKPVLSRFLLSEQPEITREAYAQLYKHNPDMALSEFKAALPNLKTTRQALAVSQLLQARHEARNAEIDDGFYMHFAHALVADKALPPLARMMAMDAIMNSAPLAQKSLPNTVEVHQAFLDSLENSDVPLAAYAIAFDKKVNPHAARYAPLMWEALLKRDRDLNYRADTAQAIYGFARIARQMMTNPKLRPAAAPVLNEALSYDKDWRVQKEAALGLGEGKVKTAQAPLNMMAISAPVAGLRSAARDALSAMTSAKIESSVNGPSGGGFIPNCEVNGFDFRGDAKQLPFFEGGQIFNRPKTVKLPARRRMLSAAIPTKTGWLAGYDHGEIGGGLLHYDNITGDHEIVLNGNIIAITPVKPTPLGTSASEFWVVEGFDQVNEARGRIYYIRLETDKIFIRRHLDLPSFPNAVNVAADQSVVMSFAAVHHADEITSQPPLRLLPSGKLISACPPPQSTAAQSLPN